VPNSKPDTPVNIFPTGKSEVLNFLDGWHAQGTTGDDFSIEDTLTARDPMLGVLISKVLNCSGPKRFKPSNAASDFDAIARSIIYQQLSKIAAATIYARYIGVFGGPPTPNQLLATQVELLRQKGLSLPKIRYLRALATAILDGELCMERLDDYSDEVVIELLTKVPGIGVWTAQMYLMFRLGRYDILPTNDLGVQRGLQLAYGLRRPAAPNYVKRVGRRWAPYRSIACLYLWASVDMASSLARSCRKFSTRR
jgi:DNA-3-methyladenine glycosylase II